MKKTIQRRLIAAVSMLLLTNFLVGCGGSNEQTQPNSDTPINIPTDTKAPTISGLAALTVNLGDEVNLLTGITADDDVDGDLTSEIIITGEVNVNSVGVYILYYSVSDKAGNSTSTRRDITVVDVVDIEPPVISGVSHVTLEQRATFDSLAGISASDNVDGDITDSVQIIGDFDITMPGFYQLTYQVSDQADNNTTITRDITVVAADSPLTTSEAVCAIFQ